MKKKELAQIFYALSDEIRHEAKQSIPPPRQQFLKGKADAFRQCAEMIEESRIKKP